MQTRLAVQVGGIALATEVLVGRSSALRCVAVGGTSAAIVLVGGKIAETAVDVSDIVNRTRKFVDGFTSSEASEAAAADGDRDLNVMQKAMQAVGGDALAGANMAGRMYQAATKGLDSIGSTGVPTIGKLILGAGGSYASFYLFTNHHGTNVLKKTAIVTFVNAVALGFALPLDKMIKEQQQQLASIGKENSSE